MTEYLLPAVALAGVLTLTFGASLLGLAVWDRWNPPRY